MVMLQNSISNEITKLKQQTMTVLEQTKHKLTRIDKQINKKHIESYSHLWIKSKLSFQHTVRNIIIHQIVLFKFSLQLSQLKIFILSPISKNYELIQLRIYSCLSSLNLNERKYSKSARQSLGVLPRNVKNAKLKY